LSLEKLHLSWKSPGKIMENHRPILAATLILFLYFRKALDTVSLKLLIKKN